MVYDCCIPASKSDLPSDFEEPLDLFGDIEVPLESQSPVLALGQLRDQVAAASKDPRNNFSAATAALVREALPWRTGCGSNVWNAFKSS